MVRLKGGDPFVFGRGGEEALALRAAGIPFEVVPGVTAGVAAAAYAGIPVTHRGLASAVALVTGARGARERPRTALDWAALAAFPGTLVFYMGVAPAAGDRGALIAAGRPRDEPAAVIEARHAAGPAHGHGHAWDDRRARREERVRAPAVTVVGAGGGAGRGARLAAPRAARAGARWPSRARGRRRASSPGAGSAGRDAWCRRP